MAGDLDPLREARRQWIAHDLAEPDAMYAAVSLIHAHQVVSAAIDRALRPLDLTFARYEVLMLLSFSKTGSLPMTKIGERLLVHPTGITRLVDKLLTQGFVARHPHPDDRRSTLVEVTASGREISRKATEILGTIRFGVPFDDDQLQTLTDVLQRQRDQS